MAKYKIYGLNVYSEIELPSTFQLSDDSETEAEIVRADLTEEYGKAEAYKDVYKRQVICGLGRSPGQWDMRIKSFLTAFSEKL